MLVRNRQDAYWWLVRQLEENGLMGEIASLEDEPSLTSGQRLTFHVFTTPNGTHVVHSDGTVDLFTRLDSRLTKKSASSQ